MKLEFFFNYFDQLAETPSGVSKMRELILQLAAQGTLVEQSGDDEPASVLVARIQKYFDELRSQRELRGSRVEPLAREELSKIPSSWVWVRLGNVVDYGSSDKSESADIPEDAWLLDLEDIEKNTSRLLQRKSFRDSPSKSIKTAFAVGDVLYGKLRPYLNKVVVADAPGYCTTEIVPIRAFGFINPAYLCNVLKRPEFIAYANSKSYGMNLPRLGTDDARRAPFPLPPLAEQKRIVAKVDELMALCEQLEAQQQERETRHAALTRASLARFADAPTPAHLNFLFHKSYAISPADLRKSILTLAVQGKLVPQDPYDKPAEEILTSIRNAAKEAGYRCRINAEDDNSAKFDAHVPDELPDRWSVCPLEELFKFIDYRGRTPLRRPSGIRLITAKNVKKGFVSNEPVEFIDEALYPKWMTRGFPKNGDLLFVTEGHTMGFVGTLKFGFKYALAQRTINLQPYREGYGSFYLYYLLSDPFQAAVVRNTTGSAAKGIKAAKLKRIRVVVPPLAEQHRIVAKVEQLMALVDELEAQIFASRATAANLLGALVAELTSARRFS